MEYVKDKDDIRCPYCRTVIDTKQMDSWDFIDGEKHKIECSGVGCGEIYEVTVERPIEYGVGIMYA